MRNAALKNFQPTVAPGVEVHCLYGVGVPTTTALDWRGKEFPNQVPEKFYGSGDNTVNIRSLRGCLNWSKNQTQQVYHKEYEGVTHNGLLQNDEVVEYIRKLVTGIN